MKYLSQFLFVFIFLTYIAPVTAVELTEVDDFGDNPGDISMYIHVPENMPATAPLVIALHGCLQDAEAYTRTGWIQLAEQWKFYLVFPEQSLLNNPYRCWNWFQADETERGKGEIKSIMAMIDNMKKNYGIATLRIYVDGLSAGGWLTTILLATYPDVFAGGATHAGGPAFCAHTQRFFWDVFRWWNFYNARENATSCMKGEDKTPVSWRSLITEHGYSDYAGPWPVLSVWQGTDDEVSVTMNQQEIVEQWTALHETDEIADAEVLLGADASITRRVYKDASGNDVIETYTIPGMEHGIAISPAQACGVESDYILNAGICAVRMVGHFWGLNKN